MAKETAPDRVPNPPSGVRAKLVERIAAGTERCHCGTQIRPGASCFGFEELPACLGKLMDGEVFCSRPCVRAYILESMATLDVSKALSLISDFGEVYSSLQALFMTV